MKRAKKIFIPIVIVAVILLIAAGVVFSINSKEEKPSSSSGTQRSSQTYSGSGGSTPRPEVSFGVATESDYSNMERILEQNALIQELPDDAELVLAFYNFYSGEREWEKSYLLSKGSVEQGDLSEYDIRLVMHSKYLTIIKENNLCDVIQMAQRNGDFGSETEKSKLSLAWKYKSILEYRDCLGM